MKTTVCPHCGRSFSSTITDKQKKKVIELYKEGYSLRDIERNTKVSFSSAGRIIRNWKELGKPEVK